MLATRKWIQSCDNLVLALQALQVLFDYTAHDQLAFCRHVQHLAQFIDKDSYAICLKLVVDERVWGIVPVSQEVECPANVLQLNVVIATKRAENVRLRKVEKRKQSTIRVRQRDQRFKPLGAIACFVVAADDP